MSWTPYLPSAAEDRLARRPVRGGPPGRAAGSPCGASSGCSASGSPCFVIWGAGTHLGPGLRAAHGQGIPGLWTAQEQNSGKWSGEFVSSSGTVTLPNVSYAGSLSAVQAGTVVPALDAGASNEVYPLTGSDKWVRDLIGVVGGTLALIALLARGFFVARRRRRAPPADYLDPGGGPGRLPHAGGDAPHAGCRDSGPGPRRGPAPGRSPCSRSRSGSPGGPAPGSPLLLADVRPYTGWYWCLAVAAGIVIAVAPVWALSRGTVWARAARAARAPGPAGPAGCWPGTSVVMAGGIKYYLSLRYTPPPSGVTVAPPSALFVFEMAGLAAETLIMAAITLLLLAVTAEIIAPGPVGRWLRSLRKQKHHRLATLRGPRTPPTERRSRTGRPRGRPGRRPRPGTSRRTGRPTR